MAEPTIDRTYDQTAEHIHAAGTPCPICGDTKPHFGRAIITGPIEPTMPFDQHVSPAILEQRILDLECELANAHRDLEWKRQRLANFERLTAQIANWIELFSRK